MIWKIDNCDFGFTYGGQNYDFEHCDGMTIEDPRSSHLTRGMNSKNKTGIIIEEGSDQPDTITIPALNMPVAVLELLNRIHANRERIEAYCVDRKTGDLRAIKNAILQKKPRQLDISEGRDSLIVNLIIESFDVDDKLKQEAA